MRIPSATYRVQFNLNFRFTDAEALVPYLHDLGISDLYASPRFKARRGSSHGYDIADPLRINSELGTEEEFDRLVARLHQYGMGLLLDIVPNHMAASSENPWWMDVLENGQESRYRPFFDVDWEPQGIKIAALENNRVILPILAGSYADILLNQGIRLRFDDRGLFIQYEDHRLPLNPRAYRDVLRVATENLTNGTESAAAALGDLTVLSEALSKPQGESGMSSDDRANNIAELKSRLWRLHHDNETIRRGIDEALRIFNGLAGQPASFQALDLLLSRQSYRLAHWRLAPYEINYRRFFDINDLVGLRVEDPLVFAARHSSIIRLIQEGKVSGLRVDHIDGLLDPLEYLERLKAIPVPAEEKNHDGLSVYTIVEKITCGAETLPPEWPVLGTTGYDFLNALNALFISADGYRDIEDSYRRFAAVEQTFDDTWYQRKKQVIDELFATDRDLLSHRLGRLAALDVHGADIPVRELIDGLKEITACLPVYRTYYRNSVLSQQDRISLEAAFTDARRRASSISSETFDFLHSVFFAEVPLQEEQDQQAWLNFITRWQQFTGAVMAKGLEDTALFANHSLISVNEVGNNPFHDRIRFGANAFHKFNSAALAGRPLTLNATSTHDTKWSEDVRARINVLSEMPREWAKCLRRWSRMNKRYKTSIDGLLVPTPNEEVIFYQAMLGIWPFGPLESVDKNSLRSRLEEFFLKAAKEAKTETNWLSPNEKHESALQQFVASVITAPSTEPFISDFLRLHKDVAFLGACNSWSQLLLKMTAPGIPDFYQGGELWNFCLTDPDNRQPVDFRAGISAFENLKSQGAEPSAGCVDDLLNNWTDGKLKLYLTTRGLNFRRLHPDLFSSGSYLPLATGGAHRRSVLAFARHFDGKWIVVAVPRLLHSFTTSGVFPLAKMWSTTVIEFPAKAPAVWKDLFTGEQIDLSRYEDNHTIPASSLFRHLPFSVLVSGEEPE